MTGTSRNGLAVLVIAFILAVVPVGFARLLLVSAPPADLEIAVPDYLIGEPPSAMTTGDPEEVIEHVYAVLSTDLTAEGDIPRAFASRLPENIAEIELVEERKRMFTAAILPLVLRANEIIESDRNRILAIKARFDSRGDVRSYDEKWLRTVARTFRVPIGEKLEPRVFKDLLLRVDVIPPSLALAQAAMESGWGTSHFALQGNALFGEWVWGDDANGIIPRARAEGRNHKVKSFNELLDSVKSYMINLNRHASYRSLRLRRAALREQAEPLTGPALAPALADYSERGQDYVNDIMGIITYNGLEDLDSVRLARG
ncbi:glucosaminidase domain-containing protein [Pseudokordiimonas caeni]|uniref:glucosaminidase domain-containing protein n=1 Tax=Pseudokordiimonas caeni TaxID=2997908 RepID=UPI0028125764|nr:glucosaminidase domain-containing protein [Pseudokordiimonas caeni]